VCNSDTACLKDHQCRTLPLDLDGGFGKNKLAMAVVKYRDKEAGMDREGRDCGKGPKQVSPTP